MESPIQIGKALCALLDDVLLIRNNNSDNTLLIKDHNTA